MKNRLQVAAVAALAMGLVAGMAQAQPRQLEPASLLIFPMYRAAAGAGTVISVTNINDDRTYCPDEDFRAGDIVAHYDYIDGQTWREFDRYEPLTPGDTLSVIVADHNPDSESGFLVVTAVNPQDLQPIRFNYLIGSAIVVESNLNFMWQYEPYGFNGLADPGPTNPCDRVITDLDGDGARDFDGAEYDFFPRRLFVDSFFEERGQFGNELTLLSTAGQDFVNEVSFLIWNNNEQKFSRIYKFTCWTNVALSAVSQIATRLGGRTDELQTGWVSIDGSRVVDLSGNPVPDNGGNATRPPLLGVFMQVIRNTQFSDGHALHFTGSLDGLELPSGDNDPQQNS
ncbi:MAG: hypothetical protein HY292_08560 [Planctomycetes bacterium]|nr:hypothetical protein [Planctomycetota bacterium]